MIAQCGQCRFWNGPHRDAGVELFTVDLTNPEAREITRLPERRECTQPSHEFFLNKPYSSVYVEQPNGYRLAQMTTAEDGCEKYEAFAGSA